MEIGDALVTIADKLGITVQQVYQLFVSVQTAKGILDLVGIALFIIGTIYFVKYLTVYFEFSDDTNWFIVYLLLWLIIWPIILGEIESSVLQIMYPEYYGAKELIESLLKFK